jgi:hypothetical protein
MRSLASLHENRAYGPQNFLPLCKTTFATKSARRRPEQVQQKPTFDAKSVLAWLAVGVPICWGVWLTLSSALVLFR